MKILLLTTVDNPFHPIDQMAQWVQFDTQHSHYTNQKLAKIAPPSPGLTDVEEQRNVNAAIEELVRLHGDVFKVIEEYEDE